MVVKGRVGKPGLLVIINNENDDNDEELPLEGVARHASLRQPDARSALGRQKEPRR